MGNAPKLFGKSRFTRSHNMSSVYSNQPEQPAKTGMPLGVKVLIGILVIIVLAFFASIASAQTTAISPDSPHPCSISTKGLEDNAKEFIDALCDEAKAAIVARTKAIELTGKTAAQTANDNRKLLPTVISKTTEVAADGSQTVRLYEATNSGASQDRYMRKEDRKENVGVAKANAEGAAIGLLLSAGNRGGYVQAYQEPLYRRRRW